MPKTTKSKQAASSGVPKYVYGAVLGAVVGTLAVVSVPKLAISILIGLAVVAGYVFFLARQRPQNGKWSPRAFSPAPVLGALVIGVMSVAGVQYLGISLAWHPEGTIKKTVKNVTDSGADSDADTTAAAVSVKPGDIISYTVTVSNVAQPAANRDNDMGSVVMKDTLPTGVELVSDASKRAITENLPDIAPGKSVTKTYQLKVTSTTDGASIKNDACFTADSIVHDNPQSGCNSAFIKVHVPPTPPPTPTPPTPTPPTPTPPTPTPPTPTPPTPTPPTPTPPTPTPPTPETPTPTPTPTTPTSAPKELPNTGARSIIVVILFTAIGGYLFSALYGYMKGNKSIKFR